MIITLIKNKFNYNKMKKIYLLIFMLVSIVTFGQESKTKNKKTCEISNSFEEPKRSKKNKRFEKRMRGNFPTLKEIKNHVAIDNDCDNSEVTLLRLSEQMGNGIYVYCVKGTQLK